MFTVYLVNRHGMPIAKSEFPTKRAALAAFEEEGKKLTTALQEGRWIEAVEVCVYDKNDEMIASSQEDRG